MKVSRLALCMFLSGSALAISAHAGSGGEDSIAEALQAAKRLIPAVKAGGSSAVRDLGLGLWFDFVPLDNSMVDKLLRNNVQPVTLTIPNEHLGNPALWAKDLTREQQAALKEALMVKDFKGSLYSPDFDRFWTDPETIRYYSMSMDSRDYYGLLRDHNILVGLLSINQGMRYSLLVEGANPLTPNPIVSNKNVVWKIDLYRFGISSQPRVAFYRIKARAEFRDLHLEFANTDEPTHAVVHVAAQMSPGSITGGEKFYPIDLNLDKHSNRVERELYTGLSNPGDIGVPSETAQGDHIYVSWTLNGPDKNLSFTLRSVKGDIAYRVNVGSTGPKPAFYFTKGSYRYEDIPAGYVLKMDGFPIQEGGVMQLPTFSMWHFDWKLEKAQK